jgi:hypothetical protein
MTLDVPTTLLAPRICQLATALPSRDTTLLLGAVLYNKVNMRKWTLAMKIEPSEIGL